MALRLQGDIRVQRNQWHRAHLPSAPARPGARAQRSLKNLAVPACRPAPSTHAPPSARHGPEETPHRKYEGRRRRARPSPRRLCASIMTSSSSRTRRGPGGPRSWWTPRPWRRGHGRGPSQEERHESAAVGRIVRKGVEVPLVMLKSAGADVAQREDRETERGETARRQSPSRPFHDLS